MATFTRRYLLQLADRLEPEIRDAFHAAIDNVRGITRINRIVELLRQGRIDEAIMVMGLDPTSLVPLTAQVSRTFGVGAAATMAAFPAGLSLRFDSNNPRAEAWVFQHSSTMVTSILSDQRLMLREQMQNGLREGRNPRRIALDIVGRINPKTGRREGGFLGLTRNQAAAVENARQQLLSLDRAYFSRGLRDRRFDKAIESAIKSGKALTQSQMDGILDRYRNNLLRFRGETIARTEAIASLHAGQREAFSQGMARGAFREEHVSRIWRATGDARTRDSHIHINGETVGWNDRFSNGLLYPAEPGGPPEEVINCRCWLETHVDFLAEALENE